MAPVLGIERRDLLVALAMILGVNALGAAPSLAFGAETGWIERPWFYPPAVLFPIVWTVLFTLLGIALFLVWREGIGRRDVRIALLAFALQLGLNLAWTPAFFGLRRPDLALGVLMLLWVAIVWTIVVFARVRPLAGALLVPYLAWVTFAFALNYAIYVSWAG